MRIRTFIAHLHTALQVNQLRGAGERSSDVRRRVSWYHTLAAPICSNQRCFSDSLEISGMQSIDKLWGFFAKYTTGHSNLF